MVEEKKPVEGEQEPESPEEPSKPEPEKQEGNEEPEAPDYKVELEEEKRLKGEAIERADQAERKLGKAGFKIEKLKQRMKEEGIEEPEEGGLSEERVQEIVTAAVQGVAQKFGQDVSEMKKTVSEAVRSFSSKESKTKGGGEGGEKPPTGEGPPKQPPQDQKIIQQYGLVWDPKKKEYVPPSPKNVINMGKPKE